MLQPITHTRQEMAKLTQKLNYLQAIDSKCGLASNGKRHEYIKEYFTKTASEGGQSRLRKIFESTGKLIVPENSVGHKKSVCGLKEQINGFIDEEFSRMAPLKYKADCSDIDKAAKMPYSRYKYTNKITENVRNNKNTRSPLKDVSMRANQAASLYLKPAPREQIWYLYKYLAQVKEYNRRESCELEKTIEGLIEKKVKKAMEGLQDDTNEKLKQYFSRVEECYKYLLRMEGPHCQLETRLGQLEARIYHQEQHETQTVKTLTMLDDAIRYFQRNSQTSKVRKSSFRRKLNALAELQFINCDYSFSMASAVSIDMVDEAVQCGEKSVQCVYEQPSKYELELSYGLNKLRLSFESQQKDIVDLYLRLSYQLEQINYIKNSNSGQVDLAKQLEQFMSINNYNLKSFELYYSSNMLCLRSYIANRLNKHATQLVYDCQEKTKVIINHVDGYIDKLLNEGCEEEETRLDSIDAIIHEMQRDVETVKQSLVKLYYGQSRDRIGQTNERYITGARVPRIQAENCETDTKNSVSLLNNEPTLSITPQICQQTIPSMCYTPNLGKYYSHVPSPSLRPPISNYYISSCKILYALSSNAYIYNS